MQSAKFGTLFYRDDLPYAALGASFDLELAAGYGSRTGAVLFCPDVTRDPYARAGLSEDGTAAALLSGAYLRNRGETWAYTEYDNAHMDARAAREMWFRPFYESFSVFVPPYTLNDKPFERTALYGELTAGKRVVRNFYDEGTDGWPAADARRPDRDWNRRLALASAVLLKNEGILPGERPSYLGTAAADIPGYCRLKPGKFTPRTAFTVARKSLGKDIAVVILDTNAGVSDSDVQLVRAAAKHLPTAVVLAGPRATDLPFLGDAAAVLYYPAPDLSVLPELITGAVSPCGRLPFTWARPGEYPAHNKKGNRTNYFYESVYNGYRYFGAAGVKPIFPFGAGQGYLTAEYSALTLKETSDSLLVSFSVTNTGSTGGNEIALIYLNGADERAYGLGHRLIGFVKMPLRPGETFSAALKIPLSRLEIYDSGEKILPNGKYGVTVESGTPRLYEVIKLGKRCKPRFTIDYVPSYYAQAHGLHILGADAEKALGVSVYGPPPAPLDCKAVRKKYGIAPDDGDFARKCVSLTPEQFNRL